MSGTTITMLVMLHDHRFERKNVYRSYQHKHLQKNLAPHIIHTPMLRPHVCSCTHTNTHALTHTHTTHTYIQISFLELVVRWFLRSKWFPSLNDCPWLQSTKHKSYFNYVETVDVLYVHTLHTWYMIHVATWACVLEVFCSSVNRIDYPPPPLPKSWIWPFNDNNNKDINNNCCCYYYW